jgi:hypothetical protein
MKIFSPPTGTSTHKTHSPLEKTVEEEEGKKWMNKSNREKVTKVSAPRVFPMAAGAATGYEDFFCVFRGFQFF